MVPTSGMALENTLGRLNLVIRQDTTDGIKYLSLLLLRKLLMVPVKMSELEIEFSLNSSGLLLKSNPPDL